MTLDDLQTRKRQLRKALLELLRAFEADTSLTVRDITLSRINTVGGQNISIADVGVTVEL